jgi:hypothetical protein
MEERGGRRREKGEEGRRGEKRGEEGRRGRRGEKRGEEEKRREGRRKEREGRSKNGGARTGRGAEVLTRMCKTQSPQTQIRGRMRNTPKHKLDRLEPLVDHQLAKLVLLVGRVRVHVALGVSLGLALVGGGGGGSVVEGVERDKVALVLVGVGYDFHLGGTSGGW